LRCGIIFLYVIRTDDQQPCSYRIDRIQKAHVSQKNLRAAPPLFPRRASARHGSPAKRSGAAAQDAFQLGRNGIFVGQTFGQASLPG
jgi:hypothetical protein